MITESNKDWNQLLTEKNIIKKTLLPFLSTKHTLIDMDYLGMTNNKNNRL